MRPGKTRIHLEMLIQIVVKVVFETVNSGLCGVDDIGLRISQEL